MSASAMTVPEFNAWLGRLRQFRKTVQRGALQHIGKYLRTEHKVRLKAHVDPEGRPWPETFFAPRPRVGERAPMIVSKGPLGVIGPKDKLASARTGRYPAVVVETIRTAAGKRRAVAFRERYGPPFKGEKALIRTAGKRKAKKIWEFLTTAGRSVRISEGRLEYGYTPGTRWIEALQNGGQYREGSSRGVVASIVRFFRGAARVPPRGMVGWSPENIAYVEKYLADRYQEYASKEA